MQSYFPGQYEVIRPGADGRRRDAARRDRVELLA